MRKFVKVLHEYFDAYQFFLACVGALVLPGLLVILFNLIFG